MSSRFSKGRVPLYRALSKLGFASRAQATEAILAGEVKVHGTCELNPDRLVNPDTAHIEVLGQKILRQATELILFHKPKGVLTTRSDPEGRPTIYDYVPAELQSFHAVGRLDMHTTGLLLLTNDTQLSSYLTDPKNRIPRVYVVRVKGCLDEVARAQMVTGIEDEGEALSAQAVEILKSSQKESQLKLTLIEGKNREVRRLCSGVGNEVISLKRIAFGSWVLGDIPPGGFTWVDVATLPNLGKIGV
jgi:23S rRNA pseudouridine2605 synthase